MDCSVVRTRRDGVFLVSTTDFFYPLVEDPYLQGRVACCNVLSDLYAMGVVECDTMLMILAVSTKMSGPERDAVTVEMIRGFNDCAREAGTNVTGGQTVLNPWPIVGGVAKSVCTEEEMIRPEGARPGDAIVLTKPLGTQVAVNAQEWRHDPAEWAKIADVVSEDDVLRAYGMATESMCRLNINAARLMHKYGAHAATDVTGFGVLGHLQNLATASERDVCMELHTLPILAKMAAVETKRHCMFRLMEGYSAETSGGLMVCLPPENAQAFCDELERLDGQPAWTVGRVVGGDRTARIVDAPTVLEV